MGQCLCKEKLKSRKTSKNNHARASKSENGSGPSQRDQATTDQLEEGVAGNSDREDSGSIARPESSSESAGSELSSGNPSKSKAERRRREQPEKKVDSVIDNHVKKMLSVIRELVDNNDSPPVAMRYLHKRAEQEDGWIAIVNSMIRVIPVSDPLGPAVMLLLLDECPLPTRASVAQFLRNWPLTKEASHLGVEDPQTHRNVCVILCCLAEKLAGPASVSLLVNQNTQGGDHTKLISTLVPMNESTKQPNHRKAYSSDELTEAECSILGYLTENLSVTRDPNVILFSLIALEKFAQTSQNKELVNKALSRTNPNPLMILELWGDDSLSVKRQVGFLAQWYLDNLFVPDGRRFTYLQTDYGMTKASLNARDVSEYLKISASGLEARCDASSFESVRCTHPVDQGVWYYEVEVVTAGVMQIGWATKLSKFLNHEGYGIGDDETSFAYDGCRQVTWFSATSSLHSHPAWKSGDILGCLLSLEPQKRYAIFFLNGEPFSHADFALLNRQFFHPEGPFGVASDLPSFFAAASFMSFQQCIFNFGKTPFRFPPDLDFRCFNDAGELTADEAAILPRHLVRAKLLAGSEAAVAEDACTLCCDQKAVITLMPCHHAGFCRDCALQMETCPMCRVAIHSRRGPSVENEREEDGADGDDDAVSSGEDDAINCARGSGDEQSSTLRDGIDKVTRSNMEEEDYQDDAMDEIIELSPGSKDRGISGVADKNDTQDQLSR